MAKRKRKPKVAAPTIGYDGKPPVVGVRTIVNARHITNDATDWLAWLSLRKHLNTPVGRWDQYARDLAAAEGKSRLVAGQRVQTLFERAEVAPLHSANLEATGGGSFGPKEIPASKFAAMEKLGRIEADIPPPCVSILTDLLASNRPIWQNAGDEKAVFAAIRTALDFARWSLDRHPGPIDIHERDTAELIERCPAAFEWLTMRRLKGVTLATRRLKTSSR